MYTPSRLFLADGKFFAHRKKKKVPFALSVSEKKKAGTAGYEASFCIVHATVKLLLLTVHPVLAYVWPHLPEHALPVVPDAVEAEHVAVHLQELPQLVEDGGGGVGVLRLATGLHAGVLGPLLWRVEVDALTAHELLEGGPGDAGETPGELVLNWPFM